MDALLSRNSLSSFERAVSIAPTRSNKPILQMVRLTCNGSTSKVEATNMDFWGSFGIECTTETAGIIAIPAEKLLKILKVTKGDLRITVDKTICRIASPNSKFSIPTADPEEFPQLTNVGDLIHTCGSQSLRAGLERTMFCSDTESSRYALGGVLFEFALNEVILVATDGRRLAKVSITGEGVPYEGGLIIVPTPAVKQVLKSLPDEGTVGIYYDGNVLSFQVGDNRIGTKLVEGKFPRWRDVIPQPELTASLHSEVLRDSMRQAMVAAGEESRGVDFAFGETLKLAASSEEGKSEVDVDVANTWGDGSTVTLDGRYVVQFLDQIDEEVTFKFTDSESPVLMEAGESRYVIMPLAREKK